MKNKIVLTGDLFDIVGRIKSIDASYFVVRDFKFKRFEVHSNSQKGDTLCLVVPYDRLDARTLSLTVQSRVERIDKLMKEAQKSNEKLLIDENNKLKESANQRFDEALFYGERL